MDRLRQWATTAWKYTARLPERVRWVTILLAAIAVLTLLAFGYCNPDGATEGPSEDVAPEIRQVPLEAVQRIVESMANTQIGFLDRIRGLEAREPTTIVLTDTVAEPYPVTNVVTVIRDGRLATVVQERTPAGYTQRIEKGTDVSGCDEIRVVGGEVVCDTPVLGKFYGVVGSEARSPTHALNLDAANVDAWAGLAWQKDRASTLSLALLYGIDQTARLRVEWRPTLW